MANDGDEEPFSDPDKSPNEGQELPPESQSDEPDEEALADALEDARAELETDEGDEASVAYLYACNYAEIPQNGSRGKVVIREDDEIAIFLLQGELYATSNICPHQLTPILAEGYIDKEQRTVTCPLHGWCYEIPTGRFVGGGGRLKTYDVRREGEEIWVAERPRE